MGGLSLVIAGAIVGFIYSAITLQTAKNAKAKVGE